VDLNSLLPGQRLSGWLLQQQLGRGGFGVTWSAEDEQGNVVALKVLQDPPGAELRALSAIHHPAVVAVLGGGSTPLHHLAMEFVRGRPLTDYLRSGPAPEDTSLALTAQLADALAAIHRAGISHGDLKPENILVESIQAPRIKVVDFGLAGTRAGGTLSHAAPERLQGGPASFQADAYSLGIVIYELLHGHLPWPDLDLSEALLKRAQAAPEPLMGPPVLRELALALLQPDPANRPPPAHVADRLERHGVKLPRIDPAMVRRRARSVVILAHHARSAVHDWLDGGGRLALVGPHGSGRTHLVDWLALELRARGRPFVRLEGSERPWAAVENALASPGLPGAPVELPAEPDPERRAWRAARALVDRSPDGLSVLVDDLHEREASVGLVLQALSAHEQAQLCATAVHAPRWADDSCLLEPLDLVGLGELVDGIFGPVQGRERLAELLLAVSDGLPGPACIFLVGAVRWGALTWRAQRWHVDLDRLAELAAEGAPELAIGAELSREARAVGGALAILDTPTTAAALVPLLGLDENRVRLALTELVDANLVRLEARLATCRGLASTQALEGMVPDPRQVHRKVLDRLLQVSEVDLVRLGWHVVGAGDRLLAERRGAAILEAGLARDPAEAARLADGLWQLAAVVELVAPRMRALAASGRAVEARQVGEGWLEDREPGSEDVPVLVALAGVYATLDGSDERALECVRSAEAALEGAPAPQELLLVAAQVHFRAERHEEAADAAVLLAGVEPPSSGRDLDRWLRARVILAQALHQLDRLPEGLALLENLPDELGRGLAARALLDGALGRLYWHAGSMRDAVEALERAAGEDAGLGSLDRARMLNNAAVARYSVGDRPGAVARWEQAQLLFDRLDVPLEQVRVRVNLCVGYRELARWERAIEAGLWAVQRAEELDVPRYVAMAAGNLGEVYLAQGYWRRAQRWFDQAERVALEQGLEGELLELARRRAELAVQRRDPRATSLARQALERATEAGAAMEVGRAAALLAFCHARAGRLDEMKIAVERAFEPLRQAGAGGALAEARIWVAEAYLVVGRSDDALQEATRALVFADEVSHQHLRRRADALVSRVRAVQGVSIKADRLERLMELAVAVVEQRDADQLLQAIARAARDLLDGERAFVLVLEPDGELTLSATALGEGADEGRPSMSVVERALRDGREIIAADLGERSDLRDASSIISMDLRSAMCVPMVDGERRLGAIYVDSRVVSEQELSAAARLLRALAAYGAVGVANARHLAEVAERNERAAEIAHDLRSPASAIHVVASKLLAGRAADDPDREPLVHLLEAAQRIRSMASGILDEARPGGMPLDLSALVTSGVGLMQHVAARHGVVIDTDIQADLWVEGDSHELARLVSNLVTNAMKYSPEGRGVEVALRGRDGMAVGRVRDHGPGIPDGAHDVVFLRGSQAQGAKSGYGLGLYICQRVVEQHGGSIEVANHPAGGAIFTWRLPLVAAQR